MPHPIKSLNLIRAKYLRLLHLVIDGKMYACPQDISCGVPFLLRGFSLTHTEIVMADEKPRPAYEAFVVEGEGKDAFWTKIGAAWPHEDGKGFNLQLSAMPVTGRVALRVPKPREEKPEPKAKK